MKCVGCPKCKGHLEQVIYRQIEIDRCRDCAGIWFDSLEAERLKQIEGSESVDVGRPKQCDRSPKTASCPRCRKQMLRMLDIDKHAIWYEKCSRCQGMWLDAGQFTRYKQNFSKKGVIDRAKQVIHRRG
ncbi:zf-TFIIB domain-containing protein [Pannus brasiliensis CCIBt3594]|uniref:Zf-TFIIB domain-containing protein n=1 Tax=Pannus brasiliensis CCIBt3594 TaxID=1427578 RepID=A0AAW9QYF3_9CHRO